LDCAANANPATRVKGGSEGRRLAHSSVWDVSVCFQVVIASDVTVKSGSFGVEEDDFFQAASRYAASNGMPRIYIACNSGARIGLVDELKPFIQVCVWL
jgi:hypothetical protein